MITRTDEEIARSWVSSGRISIADFAQLKAGFLASLDNPPDCTTCPAFEHEVQHYFQYKYRITKPDSSVNTAHLKLIILGGILMLPGETYSIVNEGVESENAKVLTNEMAEEILKRYPSYDTLLVPNPDYNPEAEAERIELERVEALDRAQAQADADQAAQDEADRLADQQAVLDNTLKPVIPAQATFAPVKTEEQPGALATNSEGPVSGQATAQTSETTTTTTPPVADQMQLDLGDSSGTVTTPPVTPEGAEAEKKS